MNLSIGRRREDFIDGAVKSGRCGSASEVVCEGLRFVEKREQKLKALREMVNASIERGGCNSDDDIERALDAAALELIK